MIDHQFVNVFNQLVIVVVINSISTFGFVWLQTKDNRKIPTVLPFLKKKIIFCLISEEEVNSVRGTFDSTKAGPSNLLIII